MYGKAFLAEKLFAIVIALYVFFVFRYRSRITSSRYYKKQFWKIHGAKKSFKQWYFDLDKKRLVLKIVLVVVLVFTGYGVYARLNPEKRFHRLIDGCETLVSEHKYEQAAIDMTNALKIRPDYVKGHYFLANVYMNTGDIDKAKSALNQVVRLKADYGNAVSLLKSILISQKDARGLEKLSGQISEDLPVQAKVLNAVSLIMDKKSAAALAVLQEARSMAPKDENIYQMIGDIQLLNGRFQAAEDAYKAALRLEFGLWQVHNSLANLYLQKGRTEDALSELRITRSLNPGFYAAGLRLAEIYTQKGYLDGAAQILEDILAKHPDNEEASYRLAIAYSATERFQEAINIFTRLPQSYHEKRAYRFNLALSYYKTRKYEAAAKWLDRLRASEELDVSGLKLLAGVNFELGKFEESAAILKDLARRQMIVEPGERRLLALAEKKSAGGDAARELEKKEVAKVRTRHADLEAYLRNKDYDSLIRGARQALQENTFKAPFHNLLGVGYLATGKAELAKKHFMLSYNEKQENPVPLLNLTNVYVKTGLVKEAERLLIAHNRMFPETASTRLVLGDIYLRTGQIEEAEKLFENVLALNPQAFEAHQKLAVAFRLKGQAGLALDAYLKAIALNPGDAISLNDAANIYAEEKKDLNKALEYAARAVEAAPGNGNFRDTLGWVHYRRGDLEKAVENFKAALDMNPYLPVIPYHLGLALFGLEQFEGARQNLKLALSMPGQLREAENAERLLMQISGVPEPENSAKAPRSAGP